MKVSGKGLAKLKRNNLIITALSYSIHHTGVLDNEVISFLMEKAVMWLYIYDKGRVKNPYAIIH